MLYVGPPPGFVPQLSIGPGGRLYDDDELLEPGAIVAPQESMEPGGKLVLPELLELLDVELLDNEPQLSIGPDGKLVMLVLLELLELDEPESPANAAPTGTAHNSIIMIHTIYRRIAKPPQIAEAAHIGGINVAARFFGWTGF